MITYIYWKWFFLLYIDHWWFFKDGRHEWWGFYLNNQKHLNSIVITIIVMWVVDMVFKTSKLSTNVKITAHLRILAIILKMVMVIWVFDMGFKTATLSPTMTIQAPLRILMGMLTRVMLLVDMFPWKAITIWKKMIRIIDEW